MFGNDRFEGFAVELMTEIAALLGFNITFQIVADGAVIMFHTYDIQNEILLFSVYC